MVGGMWFVYMICSLKKPWYYVGSTNSLERRLLEHNSGKAKSTKSLAPYKLVYTKKFETERDAREYERLLKDKRIEKERIIKSL
jgi:putative endonuclease